MLKRLPELGINFIDTAAGYGVKNLSINGIAMAISGYVGTTTTLLSDAFYLSDDAHSYSARQTDLAGNVSASSTCSRNGRMMCW